VVAVLLQQEAAQVAQVAQAAVELVHLKVILELLELLIQAAVAVAVVIMDQAVADQVAQAVQVLS